MFFRSTALKNILTVSRDRERMRYLFSLIQERFEILLFVLNFHLNEESLLFQKKAYRRFLSEQLCTRVIAIVHFLTISYVCSLLAENGSF